jgi:hypothetical protein
MPTSSAIGMGSIKARFGRKVQSIANRGSAVTRRVASGSPSSGTYWNNRIFEFPTADRGRLGASFLPVLNPVLTLSFSTSNFRTHRTRKASRGRGVIGGFRPSGPSAAAICRRRSRGKLGRELDRPDGHAARRSTQESQHLGALFGLTHAHRTYRG